MANTVTRMPQQQMMRPQQVSDPAQQWWWNGSNWQCGCDGDGGFFPPGPPPFFPPPQGQPPWYPGANGGVSFGTTAPPNPIRGAFWWDGTVLWMFDGAAWVDVGGSAGTTPPSATPPANPSNGQQWFNGTTLFVWDGNAWVPVSQTKSTISATAPPNPNPGDLWFDGQQQRIWTGSAWALVGPGATVGPVGTTTEVFAIQLTTAVSLAPAGDWVIVPFTATPIVNTQSAWDSIQFKFTPKVAGNYLFISRAYSNGAAGSSILKNDPGTYSAIANTPNIIVTATSMTGGSTTGWMQTAGMMAMNGTTDFARLWQWDTSGTGPSGGGNPVFQAWLLP